MSNLESNIEGHKNLCLQINYYDSIRKGKITRIVILTYKTHGMVQNFKKNQF